MPFDLQATSALDAQSEYLVQLALEKASEGRATLVIAHRLSTIVNADCIVVLDKGKIVEKGTHKDLLQEGGVYSSMIKSRMFNRGKDVPTSNDNPSDKEENLHEKNEYVDDRAIDDSTCVHFEECDVEKPSFIMKGNANVSTENDPATGGRDKTKDQNKWKKKIYTEMGSSEKRLLFAGAVGASVASCILPVYSYLFSNIISILTLPYSSWPAGPLKGTNLYAFIFLIIGIAAFISSGIQHTSFSLFEHRFTRHLRVLVFTNLLRQEISFFQLNGSQTIKLKMDVDARKISTMITEVCNDLSHLFATIVSGLILSMLHSWQLALVTFSMIPFLVASTAYEVFVQRGVQDGAKRANADSGRIASEAVREIKTVVLLNKHAYFECLYYQATKIPHDLTIRKAYLTSLGSALQRGAIVFANALAFYVGTSLMINGSITFQQMLTSMTVLITTAQAAGKHTMFATTLDKGGVAARGLFDLFERQPAIDMELEGLEPASVRGDVELSHVKFAYPTRPDQFVLNGKFDLKVKAGQAIALVGASGSGKSTVVGLLQRWYDPVAGAVMLDGTDIKNYSVKNFRSHIALVEQEPRLFDFTIAENLGFYGTTDGDDIRMEQVEDACKAANIHEFIMTLPQKYDTRVGVRGSQLSGGQKQRIAIARALVRNPKILLLDEVTSALDAESERMVQDTLDKITQERRMTIITISHRLSTIRNADIVCVIQDGCITEQGTYSDLSTKKNGVFKSMMLQAA